MRIGWFLVLTTAVSILAGCQKEKPNTVKLLYASDENKVVLNPDKGTVLTWTNREGRPLPVTFGFGSPCSESGSSLSTCTINVDKARVPYTCQGCADPEIVVGTDISGSSTGPTPAAFVQPPAGIVYMGCNSNAVAIYMVDTPVPQAVIPAGAKVLFVPGGITPIGPDWKVDGFSAPICTNGASFGAGNGTCTLATTLTAGSTNYNVSSAACNNTSTAGKITITTP